MIRKFKKAETEGEGGNRDEAETGTRGGDRRRKQGRISIDNNPLLRLLGKLIASRFATAAGPGVGSIENSPRMEWMSFSDMLSIS